MKLHSIFFILKKRCLRLRVAEIREFSSTMLLWCPAAVFEKNNGSLRQAAAPRNDHQAGHIYTMIFLDHYAFIDLHGCPCPCIESAVRRKWIRCDAIHMISEKLKFNIQIVQFPLAMVTCWMEGIDLDVHTLALNKREGILLHFSNRLYYLFDINSTLGHSK